MFTEHINDIANFKKKGYVRFFLVSFLYMLLIFFPLYSNGLVNHWDGIWEYNYYRAGRWSISCGRWLWPYLDRIRFGIGIEPFMTMVTCAIFALGFCVALYFLNGFDKTLRRYYPAAFIFLGSVSVCISLSYRYMSTTFGFAFLFSVLSTVCLSKYSFFFSRNDKRAFIVRVVETVVCAFLIAAQMGLYQAYIGCTGLLAVILLLDRLFDKETKFKIVMILAGRFLISLILGGILYIIGLKIHLKFSYTTLSEYKGATDYGVLNTVKNLGISIKKAYSSFSDFLLGFNHRYMYIMKNRALYNVFFGIIIACLLVGIVIQLIRLFKKDVKKAVTAIVLIVLLPIACNAVLLIATNADTSLQMTAPMAMFLPAIICLLLKYKEKESAGMIIKSFSVFQVILLSVLIYGVSLQTLVDQEAMRSGMVSVSKIADEITSDLKEEGYLSSEKSVCIIGVPSENEMYYISRACEGANHYAIFGAWGTWSDNQSWNGVFHNLQGLNIKIASNTEYDIVRANPEVEKMPCFPQKGYIKEDNGIVIVKVSEAY